MSCGTGNPPRDAHLSSDAALAESIEKQMSAQYPDFDLRHYIRLYARDDVGVGGVYLHENVGGLPSKWKGGKSYWVAPSEVPHVLDGGCAVINLRYDVPGKALASVSCNGDA